jgi:phosphoglycolate phosphatase
MRLILFDCDGTIADSQHSIVTAMERAFVAVGLPPPGRHRTIAIVGLSLPEAMAVLAPDAEPAVRVRLAEAYRTAAQAIRAAVAEDPLYPGADATLRALAARPDTLIGLATGKSLRGVHRLIAHYAWRGLFSTLQTADDNPSKPHPGMIHAALRETGADAADAIMIGDTTFDIEMARAAGVRAIGVAWGYHPASELTRSGASIVAADYADLGRLLAI